MSDTKFTIDASQAFAQLEGVDRALAELEARFRRMPGIIQQGFRSNVSAAFQKNVEEARRDVDGLKRELEQIPAKNSAAFNASQVSQYARAVAGAEKAADGLGKAADNTGRLNQGLGAGAGLLRGLVSVAAGVGGALSFGEAVSAGVRLNAEYERVKTSLTTILGSAQSADRLLGQLTQFAAETPFQADQINSAATALIAFGEGEDTVIEKLRQIGDLAAGTGKDFNELAIIYGKARVAGTLYAEDINQLVEAGLPIIQEFAKQLGVSEGEVKKLASQGKITFPALEKAFVSLTSEGGKFAGLMQAQSQTLGGIGSTVQDLFGQRLRQAFSGFSEILKEAGRFAISFLDTTQKQSVALEQERVSFLGVSNQIRNANIGSETRTRLINELKRQYPGFLGQIDAEKVTNQQLQPILDNINKSYIIRIALQQEQEKIQPLLEAQAKRERDLAGVRAEYNRELARAAEIAGVNLSAYETEEAQVNAVTEALRRQALFGIRAGERDQGVQPLNRQAEALERIQALRSGDADRTRAQVAATEELNKAEQERQGIIEQLRKTYGELFDLATAPPDPPDPVELIEPPGAGKKKTAAELDFERREKDLATRRLLLNDLEDGLEKELEVIRLHFEQLKLEYERAGLDTSQLIEKQNAEEISATVEFFAAQTQAEEEGQRRRAQAAAGFLEAKRAEIQAERQARETQIDLAEERGRQLVLTAERAGASERDVEQLRTAFQLATQKARLESEIKFQQALLSVVGEGEDEQRRQIQGRIALLNEQLRSLNIQIETPTTEGTGEKKRGLLDLLGISLSDDELSQLEAAGQRIVDSLNQLTAARLADAEAAVDAADTRVSEAERALEREIELAQAGFASNVTLKRQELQQAQAAREQAVQDQQKAARAQLIVDSSLQASNIATSVTSLIKSWSTIPFGVGLIAAFAQVAGLIAFITSIKARSRQIAAIAREGMDGFLDGNSIVRGRSHERGGHLLEVENGEMVQVGDDGKRRRLQVVRRERVREYFDLLKAANEGSREEVARQAMRLSGISPADLYRKAPTLDIEATRTAVFQPSQSVTIVATGGSSDRTNELLERILQAMAEGQPRERWTPDGQRIRGNVKTKYV